MNDTVRIEIDGRTLEAAPGTMIIQVADAAGIDIPRFCYHPKLSIAANCRMCLVEVEKAPKPLPACATPVTEGMVVRTDSALARTAQRSTMEFLLINHPLDCPICDQGGECPLQDQAMFFGKDVSRFTEAKRVVDDHDIGPLIATEMTRCIHCTRCVRFGREVAGIVELGATGRTENMTIGAYVGMTVDSELSGNMIDLCPVGALTSKPFRFSARPWELINHPGISPHDCVGANLNIQTLRGRVKRVLPRDNESVNDCWISDRDRFSYEAAESAERLTEPMVKRNGAWRETDWQEALDTAAGALRGIVAQHGAAQLGALASPTATVEEHYLLQKLMRDLGSGNVDHRLRQLDFSDDDIAPLFPGLEIPLADIDRCKAILLVGSNIRKEQPLLGLRVRRAALGGARIAVINSLDYDFHFPLSARLIVPPSAMSGALASVGAHGGHGGPPQAEPPAGWIRPEYDEATKSIAATLADAGEAGLILLGPGALHHPDAAAIRMMSAWLATRFGVRLGWLPEANGAGAWLAGSVPHRGPAGAAATVQGLNARQMLESPLRGYLLLGVEPQFDCSLTGKALAAMNAAQSVVVLTGFRGEFDFAQVLLPMAPFTETGGSFVNCEGRRQFFGESARATGQARPAWKILRVLGNALQIPGFDYLDVREIATEIDSGPARVSVRPSEWRWPSAPPATEGLERIADIPIYACDPVVRRAAALQRTADRVPEALYVSPQTLRDHQLAVGAHVIATVNGASATLEVIEDRRVAAGCGYIPAGGSGAAGLDSVGALQLRVAS